MSAPLPLRGPLSPARLVDLMLGALGVAEDAPGFHDLRGWLDAAVDRVLEEMGDPPRLERAEALAIAAGLLGSLAALAPQPMAAAA